MGVGVAGAVIVVWMAALSIYDLRVRRLPNWLTLPGALVILVVATVQGRGGAAMLGAVSLFGLYLLVNLWSPAAMGAGDVKLAVGIGALTGSFGVEVWTLGAFGAAVLSGVWACAAALRGTRPTVPHGPSMCLAALAAVIVAVQ